jgi:hypothetical protein
MAGSSPYRWRPSDWYRHWHVCNDCLIPLADALQDRVEKWTHPPRDEEDDERPDYPEIWQRRFHDVFVRPLDSDLQQHDFERGIIWLSMHAPSLAREVQEKIGQLRASLTPPNHGSLNTDAAVVCLADASFFLQQAAEAVRPLAGCPTGDVENLRKVPAADIPDIEPVAASEQVQLFGPGEHPMVKGEQKPPLSRAAYDVVCALIRAGKTGLTKDRLDTESGHGDARKTMKRLADGDRDWKAVLVFPGKPGRGYRIQ